MYGKERIEKMAEKGYCPHCEEFKDEAKSYDNSISYWHWDGEEYEWVDNDDTDYGNYECEDCGEILEMKEFDEDTGEEYVENKWKGKERKVKI